MTTLVIGTLGFHTTSAERCLLSDTESISSSAATTLSLAGLGIPRKWRSCCNNLQIPKLYSQIERWPEMLKHKMIFCFFFKKLLFSIIFYLHFLIVIDN